MRGCVPVVGERATSEDVTKGLRVVLIFYQMLHPTHSVSD